MFLGNPFFFKEGSQCLYRLITIHITSAKISGKMHTQNTHMRMYTLKLIEQHFVVCTALSVCTNVPRIFAERCLHVSLTMLYREVHACSIILIIINICT